MPQTESFRVKFNGRTEVLRLCWTGERALQLRERWPDGVIDLDAQPPPDSPASGHERRSLELMHTRVCARRDRKAAK